MKELENVKEKIRRIDGKEGQAEASNDESAEEAGRWSPKLSNQEREFEERQRSKDVW
jgi:hypothetical protein